MKSQSQAENLITAFTTVVREQDYIFSQEAIADIPTLQKILQESHNQTLEEIADKILQWYRKYKDIRDAVFQEESSFRGIKAQPSKPESQEEIKENQIRILEKELEKLKNKQS
jgi:predicted patatin/cPLA2 family phospholipase